jgi:hypothetical protein
MNRCYEIADVCRFRASTMESKPAATKSKSGAPKSKSNAPKSKSAATKSKCLLFPRIQASQRVIIEFGERRIPGAAFSAPRVFRGVGFDLANRIALARILFFVKELHAGAIRTAGSSIPPRV